MNDDKIFVECVNDGTKYYLSGTDRYGRLVWTDIKKLRINIVYKQDIEALVNELILNDPLNVFKVKFTYK